jgi:hypothetical protein
MKKNFSENFQSLQVDPITGDYYIVIPEEFVNELSWYEDTEISIKLEGSDLILSENSQN